MSINIHKFADQFNKEYAFLYDAAKNGAYVAGYNEAVAAFDVFVTCQPEFVRGFVKYRGDIISSDREAAAFMFALSELE